MPTIKEIYDCPSVKALDGWDIADALYRIAHDNSARSNLMFSDLVDAYEGVGVTGERKVDVSYDCERGAVTDVLLYFGVPFAVVSRAGRGCTDTVSTYVTNSLVAQKIIMDMADFKVQEVGADEDAVLEYWEGTPVTLGQTGWVS
jgi:hypothetical protein